LPAIAEDMVAASSDPQLPFLRPCLQQRGELALVACQVDDEPASRRSEKAVPGEKFDGSDKVGHRTVSAAEPVSHQAGLDPGVRVARLAWSGPLPQHFGRPGPSLPAI